MFSSSLPRQSAWAPAVKDSHPLAPRRAVEHSGKVWLNQCIRAVRTQPLPPYVDHLDPWLERS